jgi:hypothetical protein
MSTTSGESRGEFLLFLLSGAPYHHISHRRCKISPPSSVTPRCSNLNPNSVRILESLGLICSTAGSFQNTYISSRRIRATPYFPLLLSQDRKMAGNLGSVHVLDEVDDLFLAHMLLNSPRSLSQ